MPTNRRRRLYGRHEALSPALRHYLETGDYLTGPPDVDTYQLAGRVIRGDLSPLVAVWALYEAEIRVSWRGRGRPWAERKLGALAMAGPGKNGGPPRPGGFPAAFGEPKSPHRRGTA